MRRRSNTALPGFASGSAQTGSHARGVDGTGVGGPSVRGAAGGLSTAQGLERSWMQVNLWLVHAAPDRKDQVVHQLVRAPQEGAEFTFAPISIETPQGPVVVQVSGSFGVAEGQLIFVTNRTVKYLSASAPGGALSRQGTGRTVSPMPSANEVLSFEMPPIPGGDGTPALQNQLSLRVRIDR